MTKRQLPTDKEEADKVKKVIGKIYFGCRLVLQDEKSHTDGEMLGWKRNLPGINGGTWRHLSESSERKSFGEHIIKGQLWLAKYVDR